MMQQFIEHPILFWSLLTFSFALGAKVSWEILGGWRRLKHHEAVNMTQQHQIDDAHLKLVELLKNKKVKRITIKRKAKTK